MAEGGDFTSIKDGSDADFDIVCTPCAEDNMREEAVKYCPECQEYLCTGCTKHHGRLKATRSHTLVNKDEAKQSSVVVTTTKCRYHPDRDIEMYCETHDMVYCAKCIATQHRSCVGVNSIEDVSITYMQQNEVQGLQNEIQTIREDLKGVNNMKQKNIDSIQKQGVKITQTIKDAERKMIEHIRKLKSEADGALNKNLTEAKDEIKSEMKMVTSMMKKVEESTNKLNAVTNMDKEQQFIQMKLIHKAVTDAKEMLADSNAIGTKVISYSENIVLETSVMSATSFGQVLTTTENKEKITITKAEYRLKSRKEINVKMQNDRSSCYISDVCQLQDGTIILADYYNMKIKRLRMNYTVKDHRDLGDGPTGICCTGPTEVAVKMYNSKVQFISVGSSFSKVGEISVAGGKYWGMAYCAGELWVSTGSGVNVYNTSGTLLNTIIKDVNSGNVFKSYTQHMAISGETVIVPDSSDGAVCLGRDGAVRREFRDSRLINTKGTCVSSEGTVFLSGWSSSNIVMFDSNWQSLGELIKKGIGMTCPGAMCYDDCKGHIILTCLKHSDLIYILEIDN